jgi:hypothetical protein
MCVVAEQARFMLDELAGRWAYFIHAASVLDI